MDERQQNARQSEISKVIRGTDSETDSSASGSGRGRPNRQTQTTEVCHIIRAFGRDIDAMNETQLKELKSEIFHAVQTAVDRILNRAVGQATNEVLNVPQAANQVFLQPSVPQNLQMQNQQADPHGLLDVHQGIGQNW